MKGIKLLDQIHGYWTQLQVTENQLEQMTYSITDHQKLMEKKILLKAKIEECFAWLDDFHKLDLKMNYSLEGL